MKKTGIRNKMLYLIRASSHEEAQKVIYDLLLSNKVSVEQYSLVAFYEKSEVTYPTKTNPNEFHMKICSNQFDVPDIWVKGLDCGVSIEQSKLIIKILSEFGFKLKKDDETFIYKASPLTAKTYYIKK